MTLDSIIEDMEKLEAQLEQLRDYDASGPVYELVDCALKAQRFARMTLQRCEVYDAPSDESEFRAADYRSRVRDMRP